ncbi:MAG: hypothetical protein GXP25_18820, partial [Planctomycetes bacterium]|nr:hypothetical protein [Planctomycetota bacterium]
MLRGLMAVLVLLGSAAFGDTDLAQEGEFSIASGDYEVQVSMKYAWTIRKIIFQGQELGRDTGFYGTIFAPAPGKFIGAGHTQGGLEKVESFELRVGRKKVKPKADGRYEGKTVTYEKSSLLDHLRVYVKLELTRDGIVMHKTWEALEDQKAKSLYLYQFCWSADTKEWIAE